MTETSVSLTLTDEERELLSEILEERHRALLHEIWHTDHRDFRFAVQKKEKVLEALLSRFALHA